jgi:hypothetical protein
VGDFQGKHPPPMAGNVDRGDDEVVFRRVENADLLGQRQFGDGPDQRVGPVGAVVAAVAAGREGAKLVLEPIELARVMHAPWS